MEGRAEAKPTGARGHGSLFPPRIYNDPESFDFIFIYIRNIVPPKQIMIKYLGFIMVNELVSRVVRRPGVFCARLERLGVLWLRRRFVIVPY